MFYIETFLKVPLYFILSLFSRLVENIILSVLSNKVTDPICPSEKDILFPESKTIYPIRGVR